MSRLTYRSYETAVTVRGIRGRVSGPAFGREFPETLPRMPPSDSIDGAIRKAL